MRGPPQVFETPIALRCACGEMRAEVAVRRPSDANRNVCCCAGCQRYARALGRADEILDEHGGTDVFQVSPRSLVFTAGRANLACMQQTPKGALRWYAGCCNTPLAITLQSPRVPFIGINHRCVVAEDRAGFLTTRVGAIRATVNGKFDPSLAKTLKARPIDLLRMLRHIGWLMLVWAVRGDQRHSPFFDAATHKPVLEPPERVAFARAAAERQSSRLALGCG